MARTSRERVLKNIRQALSSPVPVPFPQHEGSASLFPEAGEDLSVQFATAFTELQGKFVYCEHEEQLEGGIRKLIEAREWTKIYCSTPRWQDSFSNTISIASCDAAITACEYLVARTGSIVLSAADTDGRTASVYAPVHICIAYTGQLVYEVRDALVSLREKYGSGLPSFICFASGPSRTADIEKTLVTGVHGPREVYVFLVEG